jgi:DNA-binding NtrC family response regulator
MIDSRNPACLLDETLLGTSDAIREVRALVLRFARSAQPVFVFGETGVGPRAGGPAGS